MLILVRHGRTAANAAGLLQGRLDNPLDELGRRQADRVAAALAPVDRVISSPLRRAQETAEPLGRPVEIDHRWVELDYGELDGRPAIEIGPEVWDRWRRDPAFVPEGGESLLSLGERVVAACQELLPEVAARDVVVVSHVSPIKAAVAWALGAGIDITWRAHLDQASISRIGAGRWGPVLRGYNDVGHLAELGLVSRPTGRRGRRRGPGPAR